MTYKDKYEACKSKLFMLSCHIESTLEALDEARKRVEKLDRIIDNLPEEIKRDLYGNEYEQLLINK